jgi:RNA polymerase sigma-70 factor (family 1)
MEEKLQNKENNNPLFPLKIWAEEKSNGLLVEIDNELFIKKAFETDADKGISLLFKAYYAPLCSHALRFVSSKAIAEDLVSDIFYEFHSQSLYLKIQASYRSYLFSSTRNRAFDYVRKEMKRETGLENAAYITISETLQPDSITQYDDFYQDVQKTIDSMPIKRRQIYLMNRFEGKKIQEIADELTISSRTVEAHLYQAFKFLRDTLREKWLVLLFGLFNL